MIKHLRTNEEVMLYNNVLEIAENDSKEVIAFLENEYKNESFGYPHSCPAFNREAALWSAKTIYNAAQLMLYREHKEADLSLFLPGFNDDPAPSEILSADLCFRFLPDILIQLKFIDGEDKLITLLERHLTAWHFSGVNYQLNIERLNFEKIKSDLCLHQLYVDRIILNRKIQLAKHSAFINLIAAGLSIYAQELWKEFKTEII